MCELSQFSYAEGSVVWVKLGSCWWPGEVKSVDSLPEEILQNLKNRPFTAVKFFDEDKYEYVRNLNNICLYNNRRKNEFIKKGLDMARAKAKEGSTLMKKFPSDVVIAECRTGGDPNILTKDAFAPQERPNYRDIFGESPGKKKLSKKNTSPNKSFSERKPGKSPSNGQSKSWKDLEIPSPVRVVPKITHRRFISESDHEVRIRQQPCTPPKEEATSPSNDYKCHICGFTSSRLNVIVLHNKAQHSENAIAAAKLQTPTGKKKRTPVGRLPSTSSSGKQRSRNSEVKETPSRAKKSILSDSDKKKLGVEEVVGEKSSMGVRKKGKTNSKKKRETEVRESLLADWGEEDQEEEEKEIENLKMVLGSSRKLEEECLNETVDETMASEKEPETEEISVMSAASPEKSAENPSESHDLDQEFKSLMDETAVPVMPEVPVINTRLSTEEKTIDDESEDRTEKEMNVETVSEKDIEMAQDIDTKEAELDGAKEEVFNPPNSSVTEPEKQNEATPPPAPPINDEQLETSQSPVIRPQESQITIPKSDMESTIVPPSSNVSPQTTSGSTTSTAPVSQEPYGILPITSDTQKTEMTANIAVNIPTSNSLVEALPSRTMVSAASSEETTETATYVLVTIDDSGALQPIDNMNSVVNTALLALDGQQDDGHRTLYIDPSQLGTQATDLENIFLAIDTRDDMTTQMVALTNRNNDQSEVQGQAFSAAAAAASAAKAKSAQDILAVALANTQVFQGDGSYVTINPAASAVTVTSSRTAQAPVMTPRVVDPCRSNVIHSTPTTISSTPVMPDLTGHIGEVQRPLNLPPPTIESPSFHSQLPLPAQTLSSLPSVIHPTTQTTVVTLPASLPHINAEDSTSHLDNTAMSNILTLPSLIPPSYAPVGVGNGQTAATLTLISGANLIMDQVTQALPKVEADSVVATSRDHVAEKRKLECDVRESKQMRVDENGGS
ncbi:uncharacterized protein [Hetaerina americana]|uniref:uncharacterized protein n=1 Tax=Hetaerina americana TaxID=62018 RepID=UPI003A7F62B0